MRNAQLSRGKNRNHPTVSRGAGDALHGKRKLSRDRNHPAGGVLFFFAGGQLLGSFHFSHLPTSQEEFASQLQTVLKSMGEGQTALRPRRNRGSFKPVFCFVFLLPPPFGARGW